MSAGKDFEVEESKSNLEAFVEFTESKDDKLILVMAEILHQLGFIYIFRGPRVYEI